MNYLSILFLSTLFLISCGSENALKQKEQELKERELALREKELALRTDSMKSVKTKPEKQLAKGEFKSKRKLRYLFYANGGLIGFYSDGSVAGCPRCDLMKENVETMQTMKPHNTYTVKQDGLLIGTDDFMGFERGSEEWAMIDYKWLVDL